MNSLVGRQVGHYKIHSLLGSGGMGHVYLAEDTRLDRKVALKILPPDVALDPDRMKRFIREAKAASALNHANVATIHDIGEADGISFMTMEDRLRVVFIVFGSINVEPMFSSLRSDPRFTELVKSINLRP